MCVLANIQERENVFGKSRKKILKENNTEVRVQFEHLDSALTELFICPKCTKTYRLKHSLTRHIKFECGQEPKYICNYCEKRFKHKYDLNVHQKCKHSVEKNGTLPSNRNPVDN